jgi:hypothetical protein
LHGSARERDPCVARKRKPLCRACQRTSMFIEAAMLGDEYRIARSIDELIVVQKIKTD